MATEVSAVTAVVVTGNVAEVAPSGTVTVAGTVATVGLLLARVTVTPPAGAAADSVTVPVEGLPPATLVGFSVAEARVGPVTGAAGVTVRVTGVEAPPRVAVIVTGVSAVTAVVVTGKVAE